MAHTLDACCYDADGNIGLIVIPTDDSQLDDPAYNLLGMTQLRVPRLDGLGPLGSPFVGLQTSSSQALKSINADSGGANPGDVTSAMILAAQAQGVTIQLAPPVAADPSGTGTATVTAGTATLQAGTATTNLAAD